MTPTLVVAADPMSASVEVNLCAPGAMSIPDAKKIGVRIAQARREMSARLRRDVTHKEIAAHMGVSVGAISKWENGLQIPKTRRLERLAAFLGVTTDYLLREAEPGASVAELPETHYDLADNPSIPDPEAGAASGRKAR